jgi:hypothetical protein
MISLVLPEPAISLACRRGVPDTPNMWSSLKYVVFAVKGLERWQSVLAKKRTSACHERYNLSAIFNSQEFLAIVDGAKSAAMASAPAESHPVWLGSNSNARAL